MDRYRVESIKKILDNENLFPNDYSAAKKVLMEKCNILINGFQKRGNLKEVEYYKNIVKLY